MQRNNFQGQRQQRHRREFDNPLASLDKLPILNNQNYTTTPDFVNICRMSLNELRQVKSFSIFNEHGKIEFEGVTNLIGLNLDQIVTIKEKYIGVYQNEELNKQLIPMIGEGLNKPARIHMYNCYADNKNNLLLYIASLQKLCIDKGV